MIDEPLKKWKKEEFPEIAGQFITVVLASTSKCYQLCNRWVHRVTSLVGRDYTEQGEHITTYGLHIHTELPCVLYSLLMLSGGKDKQKEHYV